MKLKNYKWRILRNALFWIVYGLLVHAAHMAMGQEPNEEGRLWAIIFVKVLCFGPPVYLHNLWALPNFLQRRKYLYYVITTLGILFTFALIGAELHLILYGLFPSLEPNDFSFTPVFIDILFELAMLMVVLSLFYLSTESFVYKHKMEKIERERLKMEMEVLKAQINPHFLFNSLNTIYGLVNPEEKIARNAILQLSEILRYTLYDCNRDLVLLTKELHFVRSYMEFNILRFGADVKITASYPENAQDKQLIAPMILMPFIENAFKHASSHHKRWIDMGIQIDHNLQFKISNSRSGHSPDPVSEGLHSGLGLNNVGKRLDLIYKDRYSLNWSETSDVYSVELEIPLYFD